MKTIEQEFTDMVESFRPVFDKVQWENSNVYGMWVRQQLALVRHTTRFICMAAAKTPLQNRSAHDEWLHHLRGELNHDVVIQNDLKNLGLSESDKPVLWVTEVIRQNQYYWLQNQDPISLCGYSLLLEGLASKIVPSVIERLKTVYNKNQYAFLSLHANVDQGHFEEGLTFVKTLNESSQDLIRINLMQTGRLYKTLLLEVDDFAKSYDHPREVAA